MRKELNLVLAPLKFTIDGKEYVNYLDYRTMGVEDFYQRLRDGALATISQMNVSEYA
jgi:hypothetical protein